MKIYSVKKSKYLTFGFSIKDKFVTVLSVLRTVLLFVLNLCYSTLRVQTVNPRPRVVI